MPIDVHCPSCDQKLSVPDDLIGQGVQCQKCNTMFLAAEEVELELIDEPPKAVAPEAKPMGLDEMKLELVDEPPGAVAPGKKPMAAEEVKLELVDEPPGAVAPEKKPMAAEEVELELVDEAPQAVAPEKKPMAAEEVKLELVDEPPEAGYRIVEEPRRNDRKGGSVRRVPHQGGPGAGADEGQNRSPQRRKRQGRPSAAAQLRLPALLLMIAGYVGAGLSFLVIILSIIGLMIQASRAPVGATVSTGVVTFVIRAVVQLSVTAAWSTALIKGSQSMTSRTQYEMAIIGCVVAMAPCSCGCFMGLPVGIWGLVILLQKDVKKTFE